MDEKQKGMQDEKEHGALYDEMVKELKRKKTKSLMTKEQFISRLVKPHIAKDRKYYSKLHAEGL